MPKFAIGNKYPINTKEQVNTAIGYFDKYLNKFAYDSRAVIASNIKKQAAMLKVPIDRDWIHNYSRIEKKSAQYSPEFDDAIQRRKDYMRLKGITKISSQGIPVDSNALLSKIAEHSDEWEPIVMVQNIAEFDKLAGLTREYDRNIQDPIMTTVGSHTNPKYDAIKIANKFTSYDLADLRCHQDNIEKIASSFMTETAIKFKKDPISAVACMSAMERGILSTEYNKIRH